MNKLLDRFDPFMFVVGILSIFVAVISLRNPLATFSAVVVIAAITAILSGIYKLTVLRSCLRSLLTSKQDPYKGHSNHDFTGI